MAVILADTEFLDILQYSGDTGQIATDAVAFAAKDFAFATKIFVYRDFVTVLRQR